jgi:polyisoprenoid-binding protein YceI
MKVFTKLFVAGVLTLGLANASEYVLDDSHTNVGFSVKHLMITNVKGEFKTYEADIDFDAKTKTFNKFSASIDTASIDTGIEKKRCSLKK